MRLEYEAVLIMQCSSSLALPFGRLNFSYCVTLQKDISTTVRKLSGKTRSIQKYIIMHTEVYQFRYRDGRY